MVGLTRYAASRAVQGGEESAESIGLHVAPFEFVS